MAESRAANLVDTLRSDHAADDERMRRRLEAAERFPDGNPNPVLRVDDAGILLYANPASEELKHELSMEEGEPLPSTLRDRLQRALREPDPEPFELDAGQRAYRLKPVWSPEYGFVNIYATDITATRAVERMPERNPNPVMRLSTDGVLLYANAASRPIVESLALQEGKPLPAQLWSDLQEAEETGAGKVEVQGDARWFELTCVVMPELALVNVYGTDVTALRALRRFPLQNPNPVIRIARDGELLFANPASEAIVDGLRLEVGRAVPEEVMAPIREGIDTGQCCFEVETSGRLYRMTAVSAFEFGFINLYATDITAARQVEEAHAENEKLLLNILPAPIAQRLRDGETVIADRHEDLSLLFADIVGFTQLTSGLPPEQVIDLLDDLFRHLDELVDEYELEKIKTIGDAYMVVGGLPPHVDDHLARVASMALDLNHILERRADTHPIKMRIGVHAGPAVAGVIGSKKFIYDVWGDTVNTASRLESFGLPEQIQVSGAVRTRLADRFEFEPRGTIELKGMGPTQTWLLRGRKLAAGTSARPS